MSYYSDAVTLKRLSRLSRYVITSVCVAIGSLGVAVVALVVEFAQPRASRRSSQDRRRRHLER